MLVTFFFTLIFVGLAVAILLWVKTPYYRLEACNVISLLELVVSGQASDSDWSVFCSVPIANSAYLESIRQQCLDIDEREYLGDLRAPYLFSRTGIEELRALLVELKQHSEKSIDRTLI